MAQKKITDLQLIAAIVDGLNFPADDGIQTYRATAAQLKAYILANGEVPLSALADTIFNGLSAVSPADDDYLVMADASDGNKTKKVLASNFARNAVRSVSSYPATITASDTTLKLSGSAGTITLPANGSGAKRYRLIHAGSNFVAYTLATTGGATIGGVAGGSYALYTTGEMIEVEDDGTNWMIVGRITDTAVTSYTPSLTAFGTATGVDFNWWRTADRMNLLFKFVAGTVAGSEARASLPGGTSAGSPKLASIQSVGIGTYTNATESQIRILIEPSVSYITFGYQSSVQAGLTKVFGSGLVNSSNTVQGFAYNIPMAGWQP